MRVSGTHSGAVERRRCIAPLWIAVGGALWPMPQPVN